jgi:hypothetical protein
MSGRGDGRGHDGGRAAAGDRQAETGRDLGAQVGADVGQHLQLAFLDGLLVVGGRARQGGEILPFCRDEAIFSPVTGGQAMASPTTDHTGGGHRIRSVRSWRRRLASVHSTSEAWEHYR